MLRTTALPIPSKWFLRTHFSSSSSWVSSFGPSSSWNSFSLREYVKTSVDRWMPLNVALTLLRRRRRVLPDPDGRRPSSTTADGRRLGGPLSPPRSIEKKPISGLDPAVMLTVETGRLVLSFPNPKRRLPRDACERVRSRLRGRSSSSLSNSCLNYEKIRSQNACEEHEARRKDSY